MVKLKRYLVGPFKTPTFSTFRVNPLDVTEGTYSGMKLVIVDLYVPTTMIAVSHTSVNELYHSFYYGSIRDRFYSFF